MIQRIKKAAVLGSGVMGAGIAAHLANIGIPVLLMDIVPRVLNEDEVERGLTLKDQSVRNRLATTSIQKLVTQKPAALTVKENIERIIACNLEDDLHRLTEVDWIIEVVVENLSIKQTVLAEVDKHRKNGSIVSSNTSGISVEAMAEGRSEDFRRHFLGTHFFNPPRYLKLLEVIPTKDTGAEVLSFMKRFGEDVLGKGVVEAKDTPNFIANRIGTYGLLVTVRETIKGGYSVGEVDSITGPLIGRPKSATFRTLDVVGLDTFVRVAKNVYDQVEGKEKEIFDVPIFIGEMLVNGWFGSKSGQGFYKKEGSSILQLNYETFEYEEKRKLASASIESAKQMKGLNNKVKALVYADDRAGSFIQRITMPTLLYSAQLLGVIADDLLAIDQAMKWGFGWELGPFELWDAIGVRKSIEVMEQQGLEIPAWVKEMVEKGDETFYRQENGKRFFYHFGEYRQIQQSPKVIDLKTYKEVNGVIKKNSGASLTDLGDGVALLEFHSKSNAIGLDMIQMLNFAIDEVKRKYKGLVIGNQGKNFCVGANLGMILMEAQDDNIFEIDLVIKHFQQAMMRMKYSEKPIVVAPFGMTLGGGAELCLPASSIQASSETYMGLVEVGVGLIPGGGGNKELYIKQLNNIPKGADFDLQSVANKVFETIAMAKVSTSAEEARNNQFLDKNDRISVNHDHLLYDAKQRVITLHDEGYQPPIRRKIPVVGETGYATLLLGAQAMYLSGAISEHDLKIAKKLAFVIAGGRVPFGTEVDEQYLLDLEKEAFLSLVVEGKSQQRMQHMLVKGKPLRN